MKRPAVETVKSLRDYADALEADVQRLTKEVKFWQDGMKFASERETYLINLTIELRKRAEKAEER